MGVFMFALSLIQRLILAAGLSAVAVSLALWALAGG